MPDDPIVSVALPVHNGGRYLRGAIESVLAQDLPVTEFRVFDNASTDDSVAVASHLLEAEAVITLPSNVGAATNFAQAFMASRRDAQYFMWLASDDRIAPSFVRRCIETLEQQPEAPACLTGIRFIDPDGRELREQQDRELASPAPETRLRAFLRRPRWTEFYCLYRRDRLAASPVISAAYGSDVHLTWWFLLRGPLAVVTEPLLEYREFPVKTSADMVESLTPGRAAPQWVKVGLWRHLWRMTAEPGVAARGVARRELLFALVHPTWLGHLAEDTINRWPFVGRLLRRLRPAKR